MALEKQIKSIRIYCGLFRSRKKPDYSHMEKTSAGIFKKILAKAGKNPVYVWFKSEWQEKK